jgi:hypothetical protein
MFPTFDYLLINWSQVRVLAGAPFHHSLPDHPLEVASPVAKQPIAVVPSNACFEDFAGDEQAYALVAGRRDSLSCEEEVVHQLVELQRQAADFLSRDGRVAADELFFAEQNARVAKNAEHHYRAMYRGRPNTWNIHFDESRAVEPLERAVEWETGEVPETYPSGV